MRTNEIKNEINEIEKPEEKINQKYDFQQFETIRSFVIIFILLKLI